MKESDLVTTRKSVRFLYRMAQKSLDTRGEMLSVERQVTFAPPCICTQKNRLKENKVDKYEHVNVSAYRPPTVKALLGFPERLRVYIPSIDDSNF
jgi:hypothetical protein